MTPILKAWSTGPGFFALCLFSEFPPGRRPLWPLRLPARLRPVGADDYAPEGRACSSERPEAAFRIPHSQSFTLSPCPIWVWPFAPLDPNLYIFILLYNIGGLYLIAGKNRGVCSLKTAGIVTVGPFPFPLFLMNLNGLFIGNLLNFI